MMLELNKQRRAFLDMPAWSEGTDKPWQNTKTGVMMSLSADRFSLTTATTHENWSTSPNLASNLPLPGVTSCFQNGGMRTGNSLD